MTPQFPAPGSDADLVLIALLYRNRIVGVDSEGWPEKDPWPPSGRYYVARDAKGIPLSTTRVLSAVFELERLGWQISQEEAGDVNQNNEGLSVTEFYIPDSVFPLSGNGKTENQTEKAGAELLF